MSSEKESADQPRRRGRPPGKRRQPVPLEQEAQAEPVVQAPPGVLDNVSTGVREIHKDIYSRVLELVSTVPEDGTRRWQITQRIFEAILLHLDSERRGLSITYASLMPAREDGFHSLYELEMRGNFPWPFSFDAKAYLGST